MSELEGMAGSEDFTAIARAGAVGLPAPGGGSMAGGTYLRHAQPGMTPDESVLPTGRGDLRLLRGALSAAALIQTGVPAGRGAQKMKKNKKPARPV